MGARGESRLSGSDSRVRVQAEKSQTPHRYRVECQQKEENRELIVERDSQRDEHSRGGHEPAARLRPRPHAREDHRRDRFQRRVDVPDEVEELGRG